MEAICYDVHYVSILKISGKNSLVNTNTTLLKHLKMLREYSSKSLPKFGNLVSK